eukprot:gene21448-27481_t
MQGAADSDELMVSYFEIYNEVIFDLLDATDRKKKIGGASKGGLEIKEHPVLGVYVKGLQEIVVDNSGKLQAIIDQGMRSRTVASTQMNADSSRSHSVFMITIHQKDLDDESKNVFAKINLVDLAGSERVKSTGATGSVLKEGANINKSLSALGNVINALVEASKGKGTFIPYRNSKLTRVLQESLGGNSITAMLAALSPAACNFEETLSTLKYANRAKDIKVKAVKNEEASQVNRLNDEIRALKEKLSGQHSNIDASELEDKHRQQLLELEAAMKSTWEAKSQVSAEYERDRAQLAAEQASAARMLETAKERNWALIEQKGDLDITLSHVRDLASRTSSDFSTATLTSLLSQWTAQWREITLLERALSEQDTIVQVYRTSLEKDSQALIKFSTRTSSHTSSVDATTSFDTSSLSQLKQLKDKFVATQSEVAKWTSIQDNLLVKISEFVSAISSHHTAAMTSGGSNVNSSATLNYVPSTQSLGVISNDLTRLLKTHETLVSTLILSTIGEDTDSAQKTQHDQLVALQQGIVKRLIDMDALVEAPQNITTCNASGKTKQTKSFHTSGDGHWSCSVSDAQNTQNVKTSGQLVITLDKPQHISAINIQASALGDVLDWSVLLKKNPPEKFLKRPPVRFLFDLVKHIADGNTGYFPPTLQGTDWEIVGVSKQSKLDFMQEVIDHICSHLKLAQPITTAANIVTGTDPELTNTLLQQLAVSLYAFQQKGKVSGGVEVLATPEVNESVTTTSVNVTNNAVHARFIKLVPIAWNGGSDFGPALRCDVMTIDKKDALKTSTAEESRRMRVALEQQHAQQQSALSNINVVDASSVLSVLTALTQALDTLIGTVEHAASREESVRLRKQEDVKKHLDNLSREKQALELLLESEKASLTNDKADLSEQLKACAHQLRETQGMLQKEQEVSAQLHADYRQIEDSYHNVTNELRGVEAENSALKAEILKLQANAMKNTQLIESLESAIDEHSKTIDAMRSDLEYNAEQKSTFDTEKEEFLSNISILHEELEATKSHEETLFEQLSERTLDLERLQESYVDISDQYNTSQDEMMDLRDQVDRLQELLEKKTMFSQTLNVSKSVVPSPTNNSNSSNANAMSGSKSVPSTSNKERESKLSRNSINTSNTTSGSQSHRENNTTSAEEKNGTLSARNARENLPEKSQSAYNVTTSQPAVSGKSTTNTTEVEYENDYEDEFEDM